MAEELPRRGRKIPRRALYAQIDPALFARVDRISKAIGRNKAETVELLLDSIELDENDVPVFWTDHHELDQELPLRDVS